jgi:hypothetical protein
MPSIMSVLLRRSSNEVATLTDHTGRAVYGVGLLSLAGWDYRLESLRGHGVSVP